MKKLLSIVIALLSVTLLLGCDNSIDTSIYTVDTPYISENGEFTDGQARTMVDNYGYHWPMSVSDPEDKPECLSARVIKDYSKHYYWEEDDAVYFYTETVLKILEIISGTNEHYEKYSVGDTLRILEYYSFDPNGKFLSGNDVYFIFNNGKSTAPLSSALPYAPYSEWNVYLSPFMKANTEYIITLSDEKYIDSENKSVIILGRDKPFPYDRTKGLYCYKIRLVELTEEAYAVAKNNLSEYDKPLEERFGRGTNHYDQEVIYMWEKYGDREKNGE